MGTSKAILIVDDEKNIRMTLHKALESLEGETDSAVNGDEALTKLREKEYGLILLDLKMPGMSGMEVLRKVRELRPDIKVIILTAYGTIEKAVEAIQLGAVDFIQKPFVPQEIREIVTRVLDRDRIDQLKAEDYRTLMELAKHSINERHPKAAEEHLRQAIAINPSGPEAFNLLGLLLESRGNLVEAQKKYRAALALDPSYEYARQNLHRLTHRKWAEKPALGPESSKKES